MEASRNIPVYLNRDLLETIAVLSEDFPLLNELLSKHSSLVIDMSESEFENQLADSESALSLFLRGNDIKAYPDEGAVSVFSSHPERMVENARAFYFINKDEEDALRIGKEYGVIAHSTHIQSDINPFYGRYQKALHKNDSLSGNDGWGTIASEFPHSPANSIVISDNYLFANNSGEDGLNNLCSFLNAFMPQEHSGAFQILVVCRYPEKFNDQKCNQIGGQILARLRSKFTYTIELELVFSNATIHKRRAFFGYQTVECDKGFSIFSPSRAGNFNVVRDNNELKVTPAFTLDSVSYGDSQFFLDSSDLQELASICKTTVARYEAKLKNHSSDQVVIIGYDRPSHKIRNRLLK